MSAALDEDLEAQSLYRLYDAYGLKTAWARQRIEARVATEEQACPIGYVRPVCESRHSLSLSLRVE